MKFMSMLAPHLTQKRGPCVIVLHFQYRIWVHDVKAFRYTKLPTAMNHWIFHFMSAVAQCSFGISRVASFFHFGFFSFVFPIFFRFLFIFCHYKNTAACINYKLNVILWLSAHLLCVSQCTRMLVLESRMSHL